MTGSDNFNRASLGADWDQTPGEGTTMTISASTVVVPTGPASDASISYNALGFGPDQFSEAACPVIDTSTPAVDIGLGVGVRMSGTDKTYYRLTVNQSGAVLSKQVAGAYTELATNSTSWANGDTAYLEAIDPGSLTVNRNGVFLFGTVDSAIASGRPGLTHSSPSVGSPTLDNWLGGDVPGEQEPAQVYPFAITQRVG